MIRRGLELLKQVALLARQFRRRLNLDLDDLVALAIPAQVRHTLVAHAVQLARLRAGWNLQFRFAAQGRKTAAFICVR